MDDILLLQTIERYLEGKMLPEEKAFFEQHRKNVPEVDQMVVEHSMFIHQMEDYAANHNLKHSIHLAHEKLLANSDINEGGITTTKGKVIKMWTKYRKVTAIAAVVGGAIAFLISALVAYYAPAPNQHYLAQLGVKVEQQEKKITDLNNKIKESKLPETAIVKSGGSAFLIDGNGYLITNSHVLEGATFANVYNNQGKEFKAVIAFRDEKRDLAILKIDDEDFVTVKSLPYSIKRTNTDLGEEVYTLGYPNFPRNQVVNNIGYISAETGYEGDTLSYQIQMNANHGNSGGPVLNKYGEVIGVLSTKQLKADGVTFAINSRNIYRLVDEMKKKNEDNESIKINSSSSLRGNDRVSQIKRVKEFVYMVKAYNK